MTQHSLLHSLPHIRSCATRLITLVCPCSEVAKFCQKYLAAEITRLEKYHQGNLPDSLVEVRVELYWGPITCWGLSLSHGAHVMHVAARRLTRVSVAPNANCTCSNRSSLSQVQLLRHHAEQQHSSPLISLGGGLWLLFSQIGLTQICKCFMKCLNVQVFHRMDSMLKDTNYTAELDALEADNT